VDSVPSLFWQRLGRRHADLIDQHGYENIKRHQAFNYFTWPWRWYTLPWNRHFRFLIANTKPSVWLEAMRGSSETRWLYSFATRLLWDFARRNGDTEVMRLDEPTLGNPVPVRMKGQPISQDLANTALEVAAIRRALNGREPTSILEIGAGYGRTAYGLLSIFPAARYTAIDVEPGLSLARWYLSTLFPGRELAFLSPDEATPERLGTVDLAISISSLQEMGKKQVTDYLQLLNEAVVGNGTIFLKQWHRRTNWSDRVVWRFTDLLVPPRWRPLFLEKAPVQINFDQAAWNVE